MFWNKKIILPLIIGLFPSGIALYVGGSFFLVLSTKLASQVLITLL
jgi:hypothetical protein